MSEEMDVAKLKVPELRAELGKRGLNTFGTRQVLMDRLSESMSGAAKLPDMKSSANDEPPTITSPLNQRNNEKDRMEENTGRRPSYENGTMGQNDSEMRVKPDGDNKRRRSPSRSPSDRSDSRERDSRRSPRRRSRSPQSKSSMVEEVVGWENSGTVFLDTYNCDLSLVIDADGYTARPRTNGGFSSMWAGVRANFGLIGGKAFFEVKSTQHLSVNNRDSLSGGSTHVMRVGWSTESTDFALGEETQSYGYGGTGRKSCNNDFAKYGCNFGEGDTVGSFLEWTQREAIMRFSVNGVDQGECYRISRSTLGERFALFPHIYVKNVEFTVNFGQDGQPPWFPPNVPGSDPMSWQLINNANPSQKVHGRMPPASKSECEVIMMMGLPGAGKTYYAERLRKDNREKQYNVLGTNLILDKMKVLGLSRQRNYHGRWDLLIKDATDCLNTLIGIASKRRRNYILDQTNVYPSAQRRKMRPFEGFKRKAIVIVPTDEEFRRRIAQREKEEGKEVPESAVLEMKANFGIPKPLSEDPDSVFDEVIYTELDAAASNELVQKYNQEGRANRPPPEKRQRWDGNRDRDSDSRDSRFRSSYDSRDRGRDFNRGRRDDFRRSPNQRDDRGRRDYRGGYNAERDRSRDSDRFDRSRDQDSYSRPSDRFGGPRGRFGGPDRGSFPPGGYGGYGAPRGGGMMMRGGRGGPPPNGASRGYGGASNFEAGGTPMEYGAASDTRPFRGRGGYRGGHTDVAAPVGSSGAYGNPGSMYGAPPASYDSPAGKSSSIDPYGPTGTGSIPPAAEAPNLGEGSSAAGGFRGGYGYPSTRGGYNVPESNEFSSGTGGRPGYGAPPPSRGGRGGTQFDRDTSTGRGGQSMSRGGPYPRGAPTGRGGYPGGFQSDQDPNAGYSATAGERSQSYGTYPPSGPTDNFSGAPSGYSGSSDYPNRGREKYADSSATSYGTQNQPAKTPSGYPSSAGGYTGGYQRGGLSSYPTGNASGYPSSGSGYSNAPGNYAAGGYPGSESYPGGDSSTRGRPPARPSGDPRGYSGEVDKGVTDSQPTDRQPIDNNSLYASGAARYGESRSSVPQQTSGPKQSRFDNKPALASDPYSSYPSGGYQSGYSGGYSSGPMSSTPAAAQSAAQPSGPRSGRSRFDTIPGTNPPAPSSTGMSQGSSQPTPNQPPPQPSSQSTQPPAQSYGYGYGYQGSKGDTSASQQPASAQSYGSYGYGYGSGYGGSYGSQNTQSQQQQQQQQQQPSSQNRSATAANTAPSLYASVVSDKPQTAPTQAPPSAAGQQSSAADQSNTMNAAAYASYYGYGATTNTGNTGGSSMTSASQQASKYDTSMNAAQQYGTWQQPQSAATTVATTAAAPPTQSAAASYGGYYSGYSGYTGGYGAPNPISGSAPGAPPPQYYGGYR